MRKRFPSIVLLCLVIVIVPVVGAVVKAVDRPVADDSAASRDGVLLTLEALPPENVEDADRAAMATPTPSPYDREQEPSPTVEVATPFSQREPEASPTVHVATPFPQREPTPSPTVDVPLQIPEGVGSEELFILVRISQQKLYLCKGKEVLEVYQVSTGKGESPTPPGRWRISQKAVYAEPIPQFGTRWMRINWFNASSGEYQWSDFGIHGTDEPEKIGHPVSAGCVRMLNKDVERLFQSASAGTVVVTMP
ncbi:MAG: L,D-transpeptidase [Chloroflexota bacterium]